MDSAQLASYRSSQNASTDRDMALMCEYMVQAIKKNSQQQMLAKLPVDVRKRIRALRKIQLQTTHLEAEFHRLVYELEQKHQKTHDELFEKRCGIISGRYEPTAEECDFPDPIDDLTGQIPGANSPMQPGAATSDKTTPVSTDNPQVSASDPKPPKSESQNVKGVPDFWLNIFKYVPMFELIVKECDEPVLKHLVDIKVRIASLPEMMFTLEFYFEPNEFFTDTMLTKEYLMKCEPDAAMPFSFDGPEIYSCRGCDIHWNEGKDLTKRTVVHKSGLESGPTKTIKSDTFFNFFNPPVLPEDVNDKDYDSINNILETDFEIGHYLKERIVPRAVLYFTGENDDDFDSEDSLSSDSEDYVASEEGVEEEAVTSIGDGEH